jgi:hypothetical protein
MTSGCVRVDPVVEIRGSQSGATPGGGVHSGPIRGLKIVNAAGLQSWFLARLVRHPEEKGDMFIRNFG